MTQKHKKICKLAASYSSLKIAQSINHPFFLSSCSFEAPLEVHPVEVSPPHGPVHVLLEQPPVGLQLVRRLLVERVLGVGLQEEVLQPVHDGVDGQHGLPVLAEDVQADVALQVDVGVVHAGHALHLGGLVGVAGTDLEAGKDIRGIVIEYMKYLAQNGQYFSPSFACRFTSILYRETHLGWTLD